VSFVSGILKLYTCSEIGIGRVNVQFCTYRADVTLPIMEFSLTIKNRNLMSPHK